MAVHEGDEFILQREDGANYVVSIISKVDPRRLVDPLFSTYDCDVYCGEILLGSVRLDDKFFETNRDRLIKKHCSRGRWWMTTFYVD